MLHFGVTGGIRIHVFPVTGEGIRPLYDGHTEMKLETG